MNSVVLMGRLTKDPDVRTSQNGVTSARFTLAVDRHSKTDPNAADFPSCVCFGKTAEVARDYLKKGVKIAIQGRIQTSSFKDEEGKDVYRTDVVVLGVEFCERKQDGMAQPQAQPQGQTQGQTGNGMPQNPAPAQNYGYGGQPAQNRGGYGQPQNYGGYQQSRGEYQQAQLPFN